MLNLTDIEVRFARHDLLKSIVKELLKQYPESKYTSGPEYEVAEALFMNHICIKDINYLEYLANDYANISMTHNNEYNVIALTLYDASLLRPTSELTIKYTKIETKTWLRKGE